MCSVQCTSTWNIVLEWKSPSALADTLCHSPWWWQWWHRIYNANEPRKYPCYILYKKYLYISVITHTHTRTYALSNDKDIVINWNRNSFKRMNTHPNARVCVQALNNRNQHSLTQYTHIQEHQKPYLLFIYSIFHSLQRYKWTSSHHAILA